MKRENAVVGLLCSTALSVVLLSGVAYASDESEVSDCQDSLAETSSIVGDSAVFDMGSVESEANETKEPSSSNEGLGEDMSVEADTQSARSITDTSFGFSFNYVGATAATTGRHKANDSSAYIWVKNKWTSYCKVYIDGSKYQNGSWSNQVSYHSGTAVGNSCTVSSTGEFLILNRVNENGLSWARLTGWAESYTGGISGVWSPDSIGEYDIIND